MVDVVVSHQALELKCELVLWLLYALVSPQAEHYRQLLRRLAGLVGQTISLSCLQLHLSCKPAVTLLHFCNIQPTLIKQELDPEQCPHQAFECVFHPRRGACLPCSSCCPSEVTKRLQNSCPMFAIKKLTVVLITAVKHTLPQRLAQLHNRGCWPLKGCLQRHSGIFVNHS